MEVEQIFNLSNRREFRVLSHGRATGWWRDEYKALDKKLEENAIEKTGEVLAADRRFEMRYTIQRARATGPKRQAADAKIHLRKIIS